MDNTPFFILGSVRSGTTLLRNTLRLHPRLECPEETHFYRWSYPLGTKRYENSYLGAKLFRQHRELDGVDHFDFFYQLKTCPDRKSLMDWYGQETLRIAGNTSGRWFDKTPQNVYGTLLLSEHYPSAKFVHIHRHPLNVVASVLTGVVMPEGELRGGINYWNESMAILSQFKKLAPDRILEVDYESFVSTPSKGLKQIFEFIGEDYADFPIKSVKTHKEQNKYKKVLTDEQVEEVLRRTQKYRELYNYG